MFDGFLTSLRTISRPYRIARNRRYMYISVVLVIQAITSISVLADQLQSRISYGNLFFPYIIQRKLPRRFRKTVAMTVEILVGLPRSKCYVTDKNVGDNCSQTCYSLCDWGVRVTGSYSCSYFASWQVSPFSHGTVCWIKLQLADVRPTRYSLD